MTPLLPRPLKAPGWMTSCLSRAGRRKHTQVTNELHQTPGVALSSISSQPNPGSGGGRLPGEGLWAPPPRRVHLSHGSQLSLLSCSTGTLRELRTMGGGGKQVSPTLLLGASGQAPGPWTLTVEDTL